MDAHQWGAPSVLYLSPIKALLNNQHARLERLAGLLSRRVFKWHGDVTTSEKRAFLKDPADILMTTPESLEVMLISEKVPSRRLFQNLRAVVIDEVHAFAGDDRGAHLVSLLERLQRHCGVDVQRIGLSATVGNPHDILSWLQGTSARPKRLVDPPKPPSTAQVRLDHVGNLHNAARVVLQLQPRGKTLRISRIASRLPSGDRHAALIVATVENSARPVEDLPPQSNLVDGATVHVPVPTPRARRADGFTTRARVGAAPSPSRAAAGSRATPDARLHPAHNCGTERAVTSRRSSCPVRNCRLGRPRGLKEPVNPSHP